MNLPELACVERRDELLESSADNGLTCTSHDAGVLVPGLKEDDLFERDHAHRVADTRGDPAQGTLGASDPFITQQRQRARDVNAVASCYALLQPIDRGAQPLA